MALVAERLAVSVSNWLARPGTLFIFLLLVTVRAFAGGATLAWDPVTDPDLSGYIVHYGPTAGNYTAAIDVGNKTTYAISGLTEGSTYHFAVTAYDASRTESGFSNDVSAVIPYSAPVAAFSASTTSGAAPLAMNFVNNSTGNITAYAWTFGDGSTSTAKSPSHLYSSAGVYTVALKVTGPGGSNTQTRTSLITVTAPTVPAPVAAFTASKTSGPAPLTVTFASTSTGSITAYSWTFGDGTSSTAPNPTKVYTTAGVYSVSLKVTGPGGSNTQTRTSLITATAPVTSAPVAAFTASKTSGPAPLTVAFTSTSTGSITAYSWTFGDGTSSTAPNPTKVYSVPGNYAVSLKVTGSSGTNTKTVAGYITAGGTTPSQACPCSFWPASAKPTKAADPDTNAVELGVKFKSDRAGYITGIRFYKSSQNTGTHVGSLWTSDGKLLARATFTSETASGWQQVNFPSAVAIAANAVYVASYHTNVGRYADDDNFFATQGVDNGPLHALRNGVNGSNGVYAYGANPAFPSSSYKATNYWVDVVFK